MDEILNLSNICNGAVEEIFNREMAAVLENINDPNTPAEAVRKVSIVFSIAPFPDRNGAFVEFVCNSKLAPAAKVKSSMFVTRQNGRLVAVPQNPQQTSLFQSIVATRESEAEAETGE